MKLDLHQDDNITAMLPCVGDGWGWALNGLIVVYVL